MTKPRIKTKSVKETSYNLPDVSSAAPISTVESSEISVQTKSQVRKKQPSERKKELPPVFSNLIQDFIVTVVIISLSRAIHFLLTYVYGNPHFYEFIPYTWVTDSIDLVNLIVFGIKIIIASWKLKN